MLICLCMYVYIDTHTHTKFTHGATYFEQEKLSEVREKKWDRFFKCRMPSGNNIHCHTSSIQKLQTKLGRGAYGYFVFKL